MTPPILPEIYHAAVSPVSFSDPSAKPIFIFRYGNEMHMIRHETIRPYFHAALPTPLRHEVNIGLVVLVSKKGCQSPIPARHIRKCTHRLSCRSFFVPPLTALCAILLKSIVAVFRVCFLPANIRHEKALVKPFTITLLITSRFYICKSESVCSVSFPVEGCKGRKFTLKR